MNSYTMNDEEPGSKNGWLKKLTSLLSDNNPAPNARQAISSLLSEYRLDKKITEDTEMMLESVLELNETQVREIMIPRGQMVLIQENWSFDKIIDVIIQSGHSRYPIFDEAHDKVLGILISKDLLPLLRTNNQNRSFLDVMRPVTFVPESKPLDAMLREFRTNRNHIAMVIDEYGNISGLVTIEDVIEEIVGEIDDEHDRIPDEEVRLAEDGNYFVRALMLIEDFNEKFSVNLDEEVADTIGGFVLHQFGHMPTAGEFFTIDNLTITVAKSNQRRILLLKVASNQ